MTEARNSSVDGPQWSEDADPHGATQADLIAKDWMLEDLLFLLNGPDDDSEARLSMTLAVAGVVYSGEVISRSAFRSGVLDGFKNSPSSNASEIGAALDAFWGHSVDRANAMRAERDELELPRLSRRFVHMKNAQIISTGNRVDYARIALEDVSSWSIGAFSSN